jgi:hypothetical protein
MASFKVLPHLFHTRFSCLGLFLANISSGIATLHNKTFYSQVLHSTIIGLYDTSFDPELDFV